MRNILIIFVFILTGVISLSAQKIINGQVVHGNEWIDYSKTYYKINLTEDGIYKVSKAELESIGFPTNTPMSDYKLMHLGTEVAISTSTDGVPSNNDYFIFYGKKNRSEVDKFVYKEDNMMLNPEYSIVSDQSAYFLTIDNSSNLRVNTETSNVNSSSSFENHVWAQNILLNTSHLFKPTYDGGNLIKKSNMDKAEGYANKRSPRYTKTLSLNNYIDLNIASDIETRANTNHGPNYSNNNHQVSLKLNGTEVLNSTYGDYNIISYTKSMVTGDKLNLEIANEQNRISVAYCKVTYPRDLNLGEVSQEKIWVKAGDARNFELNTSTENVKIFVPQLNKIINPVKLSSSKIGFELPALTKTTELIIYVDGSLTNANVAAGRKYTDFTKVNPNYIIITHPSLNTTGSIDKYTEYRSSSAGGGFKPLVIDVTELYDQYAYGVDRHFASIRNFSNYIRKFYDAKSMFFLVGKGVQYSQYRTENQIEKSLKLLVPTFGDPSSDTQLFCDFDSPVPFFSVGRLAAERPEHVDDYLSKMIENEANINNGQTREERYWMKNILHMSGGGDADYKIIESKLANLEQVIENSKLGGDVTTYYKFSSDIVSNYGAKALPKINSGLAILTFFGHGGVVGTDFKIVDPINFSNQGKLPIVISFGCYSGNCNTSSTGISEDYIKTKNVGGAAFIATSSTSYASDLETLGKQIYGNYGGDFYGKRLGPTLKSAIAKAFGNSSKRSLITTLQQTILHGDPAYRLYASEGSDYILDYASAKVSPETVYKTTQNIDFCVDLLNIGSNTAQNVDVRLELRDENNAVLSTKTITVPAPALSKQLCQSFDISGLDLVGQYKIWAEINPERKNIENPNPDAFNNNVLKDQSGQQGFAFDVISNDIFPTYPEEFSIVNTRDVELVSTSFEAFDDKNNYIIQVDTIPTFDSPYLMTKNVNNTYLPVKQSITLLDIEDQVYYWRIKFANREKWTSSSFVYNSTSGPGWNQSHYGQYAKGTFTQMSINEDGQLVLDSYVSQLEVVNRQGSVRYYKDGRQMDASYFNNVSEGFCMIVINPLFGFGRFNMGFQSYTPQGPPITSIYEYKDYSLEEQQKLIEDAEDQVNKGFTVVIMSMRKRPTSKYSVELLEELYNSGEGLFKFFEEKGATRFKELIETPQLPYIFVFNKEKVISEVVGESINSGVSSLFSTTPKFKEGTMDLSSLKNVKNYSKFIWKSEENDSKKDQTIVYLIGIDTNGKEEILKTYETEGVYDISDINAKQYPHLKLQYYAKDVNPRTPTAPTKLRILYEGLPDLVLERTTQNFEPKYNEGQIISIPVKVSNYSSFDANGLFDISYTTTDSQNNNTTKAKSYNGLPKGRSVTIPFEISTLNQNGIYQLSIEANAEKNISEINYFNNKGKLTYEVVGDKIAPSIDVTFDGQYIAAEEIVSPTPRIKIVLTDNNQNQLLQDKEGIVARIIDPNGVEIILNENNTIFTPATSKNNNQATLEINPELLTDGIYTLEVVGKDKSGNQAGKNSYTITFRVINKQSVSNVYNYPNPFSTSTQFIFTLTGKELPSSMVIRVYSISGKIVREITAEELGSLKTGINKTEYKWNGTDEYGNKLASGVYFYKVTTKNAQSKDYELFKTPNDVTLFKNGFGKLVIIR